MAVGFRGTRHGPAARFAAGEVAVLRQLLNEMLILLEPTETVPETSADPLAEMTGLDQTSAHVCKPADPALARLFPDAYRDDNDKAVEFRRFTEAELRSGKQETARAVLASLPPDGGRVVLDPDLTQAWLAALNDLRLAIGTRLDVTEDSYAELDNIDPASPRARELTVFLWLGVLQETLVDTLL